MAENEKTSPRIAALASKFLKMDNPRLMTDDMWAEIKSVIGSAFTQAPDKPKSGLLKAYLEQKKANPLGVPNLGLRGFGFINPHMK
ncbi:hypothetical protein [Pedobacter aquatilis]|uniref:hypothetical protein n=1 Tax=Pedobacter aquatilis TaxID=351343 RepID=UPI00292FBFC8|nr:hypothetical protein [Pedobacter aquatilis]